MPDRPAARIPILDPQSAPVIGRDADLPAIPADRLTEAALRRRFLAPPPWQAEFPGDGRMFEREPAHASVLVPLVMRDDGLRLLLTRRTEHLRDHAGQISFPGGRVEADDADSVATALREAEEEIGLPHEHVEVIGRLPPYTTVTAFVVTPVVALVRPGFTLRLDPFEVAEAFEVPLSFLMTPANHQRHVFELDGVQRRFLSIPWHDERGEYFIWGATAAMLRNLYRLLAA
jgi:8-oxo-dGTP pyrophosphatase MutT (NUDIX family)